MRLTLAAAVAAVVLPACGGTRATPPTAPATPAPADPAAGFIARAPASARAMAAIDLAARPELADELALVFGGDDGDAGTECGAPWRKLRAARGAIGPSGFLVELDGDVYVADVACVLGVDAPPPAAPLAVGPVVITARDGGLRLSGHEPFEAGARGPLADRFRQLAARESLFGVSQLGAPGAEIALDMVIPASGSRTRIDLGDEVRARHVHDLVAAGAAWVSTQDPATRVTHARDGAVVTIELASAGDGLRDVLRSGLIEAFRIPSASMWPTLEIDDYVFALKGPLRGDIARGDIVVYRVGGGRTFVSRVAALEGQRVEITGDEVRVDGVLAEHTAATERRGFDRDEYDGRWHAQTFRVARERAAGRSYDVVTGVAAEVHGDVDLVVPPGHVFLLGDNRPNAFDSRARGTTPTSDVVGRVVLIWLSLGPDGVRWDRMYAVVP